MKSLFLLFIFALILAFLSALIKSKKRYRKNHFHRSKSSYTFQDNYRCEENSRLPEMPQRCYNEDPQPVAEKPPLAKAKKRKILTRGEYKMYFVLCNALPECVVMPQVSFGALLWSEEIAVLNTFLKKRVDYVVCDDKLNVITIIELDGWSHKGREKKDLEREKILTDAGYNVLRYTEIPQPDSLREDIQKLTTFLDKRIVPSSAEYPNLQKTPL